MWYVALPKYAAKSELPTYVCFWRPPIVEGLVFEPPSNSMMHTTADLGLHLLFGIWGRECCTVTRMNFFLLSRYTLLGIR